MTKTELRKQLLERRRAIPLQTSVRAAQELIQKITSVLPRIPCIIAGYVPIHGEIDPLPAMVELENQGFRLALPCVQEDEKLLIFKRWQFGETLVKGAYGIACPGAEAETVTPDVVLVPLLAFDAEGHRLGYGAGHYDATLAALKQKKHETLAFGLAYSLQRLDRLEAEAHDVRLDRIISVTV